MPVPSRVRVLVIRHVAERVKVSNTGALAAHVIGGTCLDHGGTEGVIALGDLGLAPHLLFTGGRERDWPVPSTLVVLDATWSQVRSMRSRIPGVAELPTLSLPVAAARPRMRHQHLTEGMSTIEAIADALDRLGDPEPAIALREIYRRTTAAWLDLRSGPPPDSPR